MTVFAALPQAPTPTTALDMIFGGTLPTQIVLLVLVGGSLWSWILILWKYRQFREVSRQGDRFVEAVESSQRLEDAYKAVLRLPDSAYGRVFRHGVNFFSELRPGALREGSQIEGLSLTQLEALRLVMEKKQAEERDVLAHGLTWLAVIGSVSPLLGLMGTVLGITNTFLGIANTGSANIPAVGPGVAEALITTVAGLIVAIPAVIAYNHYVARLNLFAGELEGFGSEFIGALAREGRV